MKNVLLKLHILMLSLLSVWFACVCLIAAFFFISTILLYPWNLDNLGWLVIFGTYFIIHGFILYINIISIKKILKLTHNESISRKEKIIIIFSFFILVLYSLLVFGFQ